LEDNMPASKKEPIHPAEQQKLLLALKNYMSQQGKLQKEWGNEEKKSVNHNNNPSPYKKN